MTIHNTAIIADGAVIGENVTIGPYAVIGEKVKIGSGTTIGAHTVIDGDTTIGENNKIFPFASIGMEPQDMKYSGEDTKVIIGNNNTIREYVTINKGTLASEATTIGDNNLFMAYVHVAHDCIIKNNCILANAATLGGHVEMDDYVVVGGLTGLHQFVKIGAHAMIGAMSRITMDVVPFVTASGNDEVTTFGLNLTGLKRRNFTNDELRILKDAYNVVFKEKRTIENAIEELELRYSGNKNIEYFVGFAKKCTRGITR